MKLRNSFSLAGATAILLNEAIVVNSFVAPSTSTHQPQQTTAILNPSNQHRGSLSVVYSNDKDDDVFDGGRKATVSELPLFFADPTTTLSSDTTRTEKKSSRSNKASAFSSEAPAWLVEEFLSFKGDSLLAKEGGRVTSIDDNDDDTTKEVEIMEDSTNEEVKENEEISLITKDETNDVMKSGGELDQISKIDIGSKPSVKSVEQQQQQQQKKKRKNRKNVKSSPPELKKIELNTKQLKQELESEHSIPEAKEKIASTSIISETNLINEEEAGGEEDGVKEADDSDFVTRIMKQSHKLFSKGVNKDDIKSYPALSKLERIIQQSFDFQGVEQKMQQALDTNIKGVEKKIKEMIDIKEEMQRKIEDDFDSKGEEKVEKKENSVTMLKGKAGKKVEQKNNVATMKGKAGKIFGNIAGSLNPLRSLENIKGGFELEKFKQSFEMKNMKEDFETEKMMQKFEQGFEGMANAANVAADTTVTMVKVLHDIWVEVDGSIKSKADKRKTKEQRIKNEKKQRALLESRLQIDSKQRANRRKKFEYKKQKLLLEARIQVDRTEMENHFQQLENAKQKVFLEAQELKETKQKALLEARLLIDTEQREKRSQLLQDEKQKALLETQLQLDTNQREKSRQKLEDAKQKVEDAKQKVLLEAQQLQHAKQMTLLGARLQMDRKSLLQREATVSDDEAVNTVTPAKEENEKAFIKSYTSYLDQISTTHNEPNAPTDSSVDTPSKSATYVSTSFMNSYLNSLPGSSTPASLSYLDFLPRVTFPTSKRKPSKMSQINRQLNQKYMNSAVYEGGWNLMDEGTKMEEQRAAHSMMNSFKDFSSPRSLTPTSLSYLDSIPRIAFPSTTAARRSPYTPLTHTEDGSDQDDTTASVAYEGTWDGVEEGNIREIERMTHLDGLLVKSQMHKNEMEMRRQQYKHDGKQKALLEYRLQLDINQREINSRKLEHTKQKALLEARLLVDANSLEARLKIDHKLRKQRQTTALNPAESLDLLEQENKVPSFPTFDAEPTKIEEVNDKFKSGNIFASYLEQMPRVPHGSESSSSTSSNSATTMTNSYLKSLPFSSTPVYKGGWDRIDEGNIKEEQRVARSMMNSYEDFSSPRSSTPTSLSYLNSLPRIAFPTISSRKTAKRSAYLTLTHTEGALDQDIAASAVYEGAWDGAEEGNTIEEQRAAHSMMNSYKEFSSPRTSTPASLSYLDSVPRIAFPTSPSAKRSSYAIMTHTEGALEKDVTTSAVYEGAWDGAEEGNKKEEQRAAHSMMNSYKDFSSPRTSTPAPLSYLDSLQRIASPASSSAKRSSYAIMTHTEGALEKEVTTSTVYEGAWDDVKEGKIKEKERTAHLALEKEVTTSTVHEGAWDDVEEGKIKEKEMAAHLNGLLLVEAQTHQKGMDKRRQQRKDDAVLVEAQTHQNDMEIRRQQHKDDAVLVKAQTHQNDMENRRQLRKDDALLVEAQTHQNEMEIRRQQHKDDALLVKAQTHQNDMENRRQQRKDDAVLVEAQTHQNEMEIRRQQHKDDALFIEAQAHQNEMEQRRQLHMNGKQKALLQDAKQKALLENRLQIDSNQKEMDRQKLEYVKQKALLETRLQMDDNLRVQKDHHTEDAPPSSDFLEHEKETPAWLINEFESIGENSLHAVDRRISVSEVEAEKPQEGKEYIKSKSYPKSKPSVYTPLKSAPASQLSYLDSLPRVEYSAAKSAKTTE